MRACPNCGNQVPVDFVFCGQCGTRLEAGAPSKPAAAARPAASQPHARTQVRGKLVLIRPDGSEGGTFPLEEGDNVVGRTANPLFEGDSYLSPRHARFFFRRDELVVRDESSLNGVFVKMTGEEEVADGEIFRMGQELLRFDIIRPAEPLPDGTEVMGSPNPGYWGRLSLVIGQGQDGSAFPLYGESMVIGRERGDILFPEDGYVSGTHARISQRDGRYFLADLNSSNGSFLRVRGERSLQSGSFLLMGQQLFRVQYT
jgi:pSer/pThr/pTyr-binding forkhead associated (FHA) protein